jgi:hypothetical protein
MRVVPLRIEEPAPFEGMLLRLQRLQQAHDEVSHRDILSFSLHKRLKHMVLHFFKYAGNIQTASEAGDLEGLRRALVDAFIICMASANAMNLSLGKALGVDDARDAGAVARLLNASDDSVRADAFGLALRQLIVIGGRMAKAVESADHMETGDPRERMEALVPQLAASILILLVRQSVDIEAEVRRRFAGIEQKSIFSG